MIGIDRFSRLVGGLYDSAADPSRWPGTLADIAGALNANATQIGVQDPVRLVSRFHAEHGVAPEYKRLHAERYAPVCPFLLTPWFARVGDVIGLYDIIGPDEFRAGTYYREWCRPQGVEDFVAGILEKSASAYGGFSASFAREAGREQRALMRLLTPHVRRAVTIGNLLAESGAQAAGLGAALDALAAGVIVLGEGGRVLRVNPAGEVLLHDGRALNAAGGVLRAVDPAAAGELRAALAATSAPELPAAGTPLAFPAGAGQGLVGHLLPLREPDRLAEGARGALAVLFVQGPDTPFPMPGEGFVRLYGLTGGEWRVLLALLRGAEPASIAAEHGIALATVKTHLRNLFVKTGTTRQSALVRLAAASAPGLRAA